MKSRIFRSIPTFFIVVSLSFVLLGVHASPIGVLFILTVALLIIDIKSQPQLLVIYMAILLLLVNISYLVRISNDDIAIYIYCILSFIYVIKSSRPSFFQAQSYLHLSIFLLLSISFWLFMNSQQSYKRVIHTIFNLGYDQVGHFAIMRALSKCSEYLYICDPNSNLLPKNYMFYPQQWHILFSKLMNSGDLVATLGSYIFIVIISTVISLYLLSFSIRQFTQDVVGIGFKNYPNLYLSTRVLHSTIYLLILVLSLLGYPNFVFASALFIFAIATYERNRTSSYCLASSVLIISISMYTLFLVPSIVIFLLCTFFFQGSKGLKALCVIIWIVFSYSVVALAWNKSHVDFIGIGGGGISLVVITTEVILLTGLLLNLLQVKRKEVTFPSPTGNLIIGNAIVFVSLIGLNVLLIFIGNTTGYYLAKFSYFAVIVGLINLFIALSKLNFRIPSPQMTSSSICLIIAITWYMTPRIPFTSPLVNFVDIITGPSEIQKARIVSIYSAAKLSEASEKPVVLLSSSSGPDTQWVNSLSGNWSAYLNNFLENKIDNETEFRDPKFQEANKEILVFFEAERK